MFPPMSPGKNRYLAVFENLPSPAFLFDRDGRLENLNRAAALVLGERGAPGRGRTGKGAAGEPPHILAEDLERFLHAGVPSRGYEKSVNTAVGLRHYQVEMQRTNDPSGEFDGTVVILNDITRRREAEETLQVLLDEMEARVEERAGEAESARDLLQALVDSVPAHIFVKDRETRFLLVNRSMLDAMGLSRGEMVGRSAFDLFPEEHARKYSEDDLTVISSGEARSGISEPLETVRGTRWCITHKVPHRDTQGNVVGVIGVAVDVTELRDAEQGQRYLNRALRMMWGCSRALQVAREETELLSEVCRIAVEVGGYRLAWAGYAEDGPGKAVRPVGQFGFEDGYLQKLSITWADVPRGRGPTGTAIRTGVPAVVHNIQADPLFEPWREEALSRGYRSCAAFPLGGEGRPLGSLNIYATESDAFSEEEVGLLSELSDTLAYGIRSLRVEAARRGEEERREVAEVRLRRAQRMESVAKLAGGVAHNLNNLLTVVNGYGFLLEKDMPEADSRRKMVEEILRAGQRAAELTNQLLSYSRQQMLTPREIEVGALLREMEPGLREICGPGVALSLSSGRCVLRVDTEGFRQMLLRLLTHACEEMERVGSISIRAFEEDLDSGEAPPEVGLAAGDYLVLTVQDTGPPMDEELLSHIFDPFHRPLETGSGLELSSVYGFVKQSGGYIWAGSEPGVGNRFTACFPRPCKEDPPLKKS